MDSSALRWKDWDWRPLARLVLWLALGAAWANSRGLLTMASLNRLAHELALGWLLSFGLLTYVQVVLATGALHLALSIDDLAYGLSERLVGCFLDRPRFATAFVVAFTIELALVLMSGRLLAGVLR